MLIASNTPNSFHLREGYKFVQLGDMLEQTDAIVLMLAKNWGSASVQKIKALTHWVSLYPKRTPCYIVGCESTIPNTAVERYQHKERDDAVRALCDEVLARSKSIGVRGEITYIYLTQLLGYSCSEVDVIYESNSADNKIKLSNFLKKNEFLPSLESSLSAFQERPYVIYERSISFSDKIHISRPYISKSENSVRLNSDINIDGEITTLWCETDIDYEEFLLFERSDAFVCAVLPFAMRVGKDIISEAPVSMGFLHNLREVLIPQLCAHDPRIHNVKIYAEGDSSRLSCAGAVATAMSCGVDSFYTASLYKSSEYNSMNLTHLYCGNYLYGNDGLIYERAAGVAKEFGLPLVHTATNINEALRLPHLFTHFLKTMFGVLSLRKLFRIYYYSTAEDFSNFDLKNNSIRDTVKIELLLLYAFSLPEFQVLTGGAKSARLEKTRAISGSSAAQKFLNVCLYPNRESNCGDCKKCMRTLLMLDMLGSLEQFGGVFDIERYRRDRTQVFSYLVREKDSSMLSEVYNHFLRTEPGLIAAATARIY